MKKLLHRLKNPLFWLLVLFFSVSSTADSFAASRLRILNNKLSPATACKSYSVNIFADGGVPGTSPNKYTWTITGAPAWLTTTPASGGTGDNLTLSATTTVISCTATYKIIVAAGDSDNNIVQKTFILSVNKGGICIINNSGSPQFYTATGVTCTPWPTAGANISPAIISFQAYTDAACATTCGAITSYSDQKTIDGNNNCTTQITTAGCVYSDN